MASDALREALEIVARLERVRSENRLAYYQPYDWQLRFHNATGHGTRLPATEKAAMAGNQTGKSTAGAAESAIHLTGLYPDWYEGIRFDQPVYWVCAGTTNETTRNIIQKELFGDPRDPAAFGTGMIPKRLLGAPSRKPGVPDAYESVPVLHKTGRYSTCELKCYEQGYQKFMGYRAHGGWLDEEPPQEIMSQLRRSTFSKDKSVILLTFTPEEGITKVVYQFTEKLELGQALITATWDDAPHMTPELREKKLATIPQHERDMRTQGKPFAGAGLIFPVTEESVLCEPIEIPRHWPQLVGIDFGWDHPFAAARIAHDRDADCVYLVSEYREKKQTPPIHAAAIRPWGEWIPVVWPPDGLQTEKGSGTTLAQAYRSLGLALRNEHFTNPPAAGQKEGSGGIGVEPGLIEMLTRMQTGRFKIFRTCRMFPEEMRMYHRDKHGKVVKLHDDVISATRYAVMSLRHATTQTVRVHHRQGAIGATNW